MPVEPAKTRRPRGRPPRADGAATAERLVDAASSVCAEYGYDGSTVSLIAERADVHPTAIYNHFDSREDLLYAAAVRALEQITALVVESSDDLRSFHAIPAAYLRSGMAQQRRVIAEIHLAGARHERLAGLLADWHRRWSDALVERLPSTDPDPRATVKMLYLLLLGLCHLDDLPAVRAPRTAVTVLAEQMVKAVVPDPGP